MPPVPPPRETANNKEYVAMYDYDPTDEWGLELVQASTVIPVDTFT